MTRQSQNPARIPAQTSPASFGIDFVNPSTRWADIVAGPPAAAAIAHVRKILGFAETRRAEAGPAAARAAGAEPVAAPALPRAA